jgi:hypothetical protein
VVAPELSLAPFEPAAPAPRDTFARLGQITRTITVEQCAYLALFVSAVLTRFWDLGSRALHHDESLHAWFSYNYAIGKGYQHDPLMHGPFLFTSMHWSTRSSVRRMRARATAPRSSA